MAKDWKFFLPMYLIETACIYSQQRSLGVMVSQDKKRHRSFTFSLPWHLSNLSSECFLLIPLMTSMYPKLIQLIFSPNFIFPVLLIFYASMTKCHILSGLEWNKFLFYSLWGPKSEIRVLSIVVPLGILRKILFCISVLASGIWWVASNLWSPLVYSNISLISASVFTWTFSFGLSVSSLLLMMTPVFRFGVHLDPKWPHLNL